MTGVLIYRVDGAFSDVGDDDTAYGGSRSPGYDIIFFGIANTPELWQAERTWARKYWSALRPYTNDTGAYVNSMTEYEEHRVRARYGPAKCERLARVKSIYDSDNVFHRNANIKPAKP